MRSASPDAASSGGAAGVSGSSYDLPPGAESVITQVTSLEIQAPSTSQAAAPASISQQQHPQQQHRRRRRHRRHRSSAAAAAAAAAARRKGSPLRQLLEALRSTLCFCFPSAVGEEGEEEDYDQEGMRRRGGAGSSRASSAPAAASAGGGPSRSPGSASSSAAGSAASAGSAGSELLFLPPAPPPAPPFEGPPVIGPRSQADAALGRKTLVLDLDETLVHSSFRPVPNADFVIPVEIDGRCVDVYVLKRPHVDEFLAQVGPRFEVVVFTASLAKYADPLLDLLDASTGAFKWRLFRDACVAFEGNYVKDLQCLGRPLSDSIIVDNSPHSYVFQPDNAVPVSTFIDDPADTELLQILPLLLAVERVPDVRPHLAHHVARLAEAQASRGREGG